MIKAVIYVIVVFIIGHGLLALESFWGDVIALSVAWAGGCLFEVPQLKQVDPDRCKRTFGIDKSI
jgi:hypothetical protein